MSLLINDSNNTHFITNFISPCRGYKPKSHLILLLKPNVQSSIFGNLEQDLQDFPRCYVLGRQLPPRPLLPQRSHRRTSPPIQQIVQRLPLPAEVETNSAILNMKDVVDGQELKIQKNMIHLEDECRYESVIHPSPCKSEAVWMKEEPHEHSYWNPEE